MKKRVDENRRRYVRAEEEIEFLKAEIEILNDIIDNNRFAISEDDKHRDLLNQLYQKGIINEERNFIE